MYIVEFKCIGKAPGRSKMASQPFTGHGALSPSPSFSTYTTPAIVGFMGQCAPNANWYMNAAKYESCMALMLLLCHSDVLFKKPRAWMHPVRWRCFVFQKDSGSIHSSSTRKYRFRRKSFEDSIYVVTVKVAALRRKPVRCWYMLIKVKKTYI